MTHAVRRWHSLTMTEQEELAARLGKTLSVLAADAHWRRLSLAAVQALGGAA